VADDIDEGSVAGKGKIVFGGIGADGLAALGVEIRQYSLPAGGADDRHRIGDSQPMAGAIVKLDQEITLPAGRRPSMTAVARPSGNDSDAGSPRSGHSRSGTVHWPLARRIAPLIFAAHPQREFFLLADHTGSTAIQPRRGPASISIIGCAAIGT